MRFPVFWWPRLLREEGTNKVPEAKGYFAQRVSALPSWPALHRGGEWPNFGLSL